MRSPGEKVDRYTIEATLGQGGMGEVYEATDTRLGRRVALKLLPRGADPSGTQRMLREARAAAALDHPNAVTVYDVGELEGEMFLAMELVRGRPLRAHVGDEAKPIARRIRWLVEVARALGAAHAAGIVHRDVKPDNVMLREDGRIKVLDFGIARRAAGEVDPSAPTEAGAADLATLTQEGAIVGTPRYASPEQLRREPLDAKSDQFSWAVMAYELLLGEPPFAGADAVGLIAQILSTEPTPLADRVKDVPREASEVIARAMAKQPDARFPTIDEAADALEPFAEAVTSTGDRAVTTATTAASTTRPEPHSSRRLGAIALVVALAAGGVALWWGTSGEREPADGAGAPAKEVVRGLECADAEVTGEDVDPRFAGALGVGACARLATELGVDWRVSGGSHLDVSVELGDRTHVTLALGEHRASAAGATPLEAVDGAVASLASELEAPPMTAEQARAWGTEDPAAARQIERVWRRLVLAALPNEEGVIRELAKAHPESPWPEVLLGMVAQRGGADSDRAFATVLERLSALPPARANALKGIVLFIRSAQERKEGLRLMRQAYAETPDDPDVASLYAALALYDAPDEGFAVVDRLAEQFPTRSIVSLTNALTAPEDIDLERDRRYLQRLHEIFPESHAWWHSARFHILSNELDEARRDLAYGRALGVGGKAGDKATLDWMVSWVELASLRPEAARVLAKSTMSDPRATQTALGARVTTYSYAMEGRMIDADSALEAELARQLDVGSPREALRYAIQDLTQRRRLGRPPPGEARLVWIDTTIGERGELPPTAVAAYRAEHALAKGRPAPAEALAKLEEMAAAVDMPARRRESIHTRALALVRAVRGDAAAVELWRASASGSVAVRAAVAFDAALACEAVGDDDQAIEAYRLSMHPINSDEPVEYVAARLRLARLLRKKGETAEADALAAQVDAVWAHADEGVREAALAVK